MTPDSGPVDGEVPAVGATRGDGLSGGRMTWASAVAGPLADCTCLWQDLDGLHVEPAPADAPPTSILWGWRGESVLVRVRLDGDTAYVAVLDLASVHVAADGTAAPGVIRKPVVTVPWAVDDGRVAAAVSGARAGRGPAPEVGGVGGKYEQVIVGGIDTGPITFVRPSTDA